MIDTVYYPLTDKPVSRTKGYLYEVEYDYFNRQLTVTRGYGVIRGYSNSDEFEILVTRTYYTQERHRKMLFNVLNNLISEMSVASISHRSITLEY